MITARIGIFGGTFDPIHIGHLRTAVEVLEQCELDHVRLIPCYQAPHRQTAIASMDQRCTMIHQAIHREARLVLDTREARLPSPSYTINTLVSLQTELPQARFYLIVGTDALQQFTTWHQWEKILAYAHLLVVTRTAPPVEISPLLRNYMTNSLKELHTLAAGKIFLLNIPLLEIASSQIRDYCIAGKNPRYLLTEHVYNYIQQQQLYRL